MNFLAAITWDGLFSLYPALCLVGTVFLLLLIPLIRGRRRGSHYALLAFVGLSFALLLLLNQAAGDRSDSPLNPKFSNVLGPGLILDPMGWFFGLAIIGSALLCILIIPLTSPGDAGTDLPEHFVFILISVLGWCLSAMSNNLLMLFVGVNMGVLPMCLLMAQRRSPEGAEAALKICLPGLLAIAVMFYGISLFYAGLGSIELKPAPAPPDLPVHRILGAMGLLMITTGSLFFAGCLPMNSWLADIQEACSPDIALFSAIVAAIGSFSILLRLAPLMEQIGGSLALSVNVFALIFIVCGVLTCVWNNLAALAQRNVLRMTGYMINGLSGGLVLTVGAGLMLPEIFSRTDQAVIAGDVIFYVLTVGLSIPGILAMVQAGQASDFSDLSSVVQRQPWAAFCAIVSIGSMAGFPLTSGFVLKLHLVALLINHLNGITLLALIGLSVGTLLSVLVWLRLSAWVYFRRTDGPRIKTVPAIVVLAVAFSLPNATLTLAYSPLSRLVEAFAPASSQNPTVTHSSTDTVQD
jgi:NADH-quinone oxidoreductase subunit N